MALRDQELQRAVEFLRAHFDSYEQLQVLRLVAGGRDRSWTAAAVAQELDLVEPEAARALDHLCARNLLDIRISGQLHFRYNPGSEEVGRQADAFLRALDRDPVTLARMMAEHQREQERSAALRAFTDAFLLRGRKHDG